MIPRWKKTLIVSWSIQILSLTGFGFILPFLPLYIQELGNFSQTELRYWVGLTSAGPALMMGLMAPVWGLLADRWGRKLMLLRATLGGSITMALIGMAGSVQSLLVFRLLHGLFSGTVTAAAILVASNTPKNRLSYALGFLSSSTFIGFSSGPLIGGLLAEFIGYRSTFTIGSALIFVAFLLVILFINDEQPLPHMTDESTERFSIRDILKAPYLFVFVVLFFIRIARIMPIPFLPLHVQEIRGSTGGVSAITGIISAARGVAAALAGITISRFADRFDKTRMVAILSAVAAALALPMYFTNGLWSFTGFFVVSTFFISGVEPILQSLMSVHTSPRHRGIIFGFQTMVGSLGWFCAPLTGSAVSIHLSIKHTFLAHALLIAGISLVIWTIYFRKRSVRTSG